MTPTTTPAGLLVRADTRPGTGVGHAMRQLALVERWTGAGGAATVVVDAPTPWLRARLEAAGAEVVAVRATSDDGRTELVERAGDDAVDWVIFDGYLFDREVQRAVAAAGVGVAVVDDHAQIAGRRAHDADVVIDPNLGPCRPEHDRRPPGSALLHGPRFALLRDEFRRPGPAAGEPRTRLVVLSGGERAEAGERLADRLGAAVDERHPHIEVTTPARAGRRDDLAALLRTATLAVSAAGSTAWELAHLGVPMVLFAVADNQEPVGEALATAGAARYVGRLDGPAPAATARIGECVLALLDDDDARRDLAAAGRALVDGYGAQRLETELRSSLVGLRPARLEDARLLWAWANDPAVRAASFGTDPIPWEDHLTWFEAKLADPFAQVLVAVDRGRPWGLVRFDSTDATPEIGVSVAADARGGGAAAGLIRAGVRRVLADTTAPLVTARVKPENVASLRAFRAADFEVESDRPGEPVHLRYPRGRDGRR